MQIANLRSTSGFRPIIINTPAKQLAWCKRASSCKQLQEIYLKLPLLGFWCNFLIKFKVKDMHPDRVRCRYKRMYIHVCAHVHVNKYFIYTHANIYIHLEKGFIDYLLRKCLGGPDIKYRSVRSSQDELILFSLNKCLRCYIWNLVVSCVPITL